MCTAWPQTTYLSAVRAVRRTEGDENNDYVQMGAVTTGEVGRVCAALLGGEVEAAPRPLRFIVCKPPYWLFRTGREESSLASASGVLV